MKQLDIAIDLDDTLFDFTAGFKTFYAKMRELDEKHFPDPVSWDFSKEWGMENQDELHAAMRVFANEQGFAHLKPITNALRYMKLLKQDGHNLKIVTCRDESIASGNYFLKRGIQQQTLFALEHHRVEYDELHFVKNKVSVSMDVLFDDAPHHLYIVEKNGVIPVCLATSANTAYTGKRVADWSAFYSFIQRYTENE